MQSQQASTQHYIQSQNNHALVSGRCSISAGIETMLYCLTEPPEQVYTAWQIALDADRTA